MPRPVLALLLAAIPLAAVELSIRVSGESGDAIWPRIEVRDSGGKMHQPAGAILDEPITRGVRAGDRR